MAKWTLILIKKHGWEIQRGIRLISKVLGNCNVELVKTHSTMIRPNTLMRRRNKICSKKVIGKFIKEQGKYYFFHIFHQNFIYIFSSIKKFLGRFPDLMDKHMRLSSDGNDLVNNMKFSESSYNNPFRKQTDKE